MGEGSSLLVLEEVNVDDCGVWLFPCVMSGPVPVPLPLPLPLPFPLSLVLRSTIGLLVILVGNCEGRPRRTSGTLYQAPGWMSRLKASLGSGLLGGETATAAR